MVLRLASPVAITVVFTTGGLACAGNVHESAGIGASGSTGGASGGTGSGGLLGAGGGTSGCNEATCTPTMIASGQHEPRGIAVDGTSVYWTTKDGFIMKAPSDGGPADQLASGQTQPFAITVDAKQAYWANVDSVAKIAITGGSTTTLYSGGVSLNGLAIDSSHIYWTELGSVALAPIAGGAKTTLFNGQPQPLAIAVDQTSVYWTDVVGNVKATPKGGGAGTVLSACTSSSSMNYPAGIAVDANFVYWTDRYCGAVLKAPKMGGAAMVLASGQLGPWGIAVDATHVFWTNVGAETCQDSSACPGGSCVLGHCLPQPCGACALMKVPVTGGKPVTLAAGINLPDRIALDTAHVYWTNQGDGTIMKIGK
jgi:hypothetical protein